MNCLDSGIIQEYLDGEFDMKRINSVELHLQECEKCKLLYEEIKSSRLEIKEFLSALIETDDSVTIPPPIIFNHGKKSSYRRISVTPMLKVAAGVALFIGLFWIVLSRLSQQTKPVENADLMVSELIGDSEPNNAWHSSQMVIIITDEKGEVIESFLSSEN